MFVAAGAFAGAASVRSILVRTHLTNIATLGAVGGGGIGGVLFLNLTGNEWENPTAALSGILIGGSWHLLSSAQATTSGAAESTDSSDIRRIVRLFLIIVGSGVVVGMTFFGICFLTVNPLDKAVTGMRVFALSFIVSLLVAIVVVTSSLLSTRGNRKKANCEKDSLSRPETDGEPASFDD